MNNETWKEVEGTKGQYFISDAGRVKSMFKPLRNGCCFREKVLKSSLAAHGYCVVNIHRTPMLVHRLVAMAFLSPVPGKDLINHKNGIRTDNRVENVEWCNKSENAKHAFDVLGVKGSALGKFGKNNPSSKPVVCIEPSGVKKHFFSVREAGNNYGIRDSYVSRVCKGKRAHTKGLKFYYQLNFLKYPSPAPAQPELFL